MIISKLKILIEYSKTLLIFSIYFTLYLSVLSTPELSFQSAFTKKTREHCLGIFIAENLFLFPSFNVVSLTTPHFLFSLTFVRVRKVLCSILFSLWCDFRFTEKV